MFTENHSIISIVRGGGSGEHANSQPLPSPSLNDWIYKDLSSVGFLESRSKYVQKIMPFRIAGLQKLIEKHKPKVVVFYGRSYAKYWQEISGGRFKESEKNVKFGLFNSERTKYVIAPHPVARGVSNKDFELII